MHSGLLNVVTVFSNPVRWKSRLALYKRFEEHMLDSGVDLTAVEVSFGERKPELANPHVRHVKIRANGHAVAWHKESALNIGIARLPPGPSTSRRSTPTSNSAARTGRKRQCMPCSI